jgi:transcriptional regulator GlxA family with amidase domain
VEIFIFMLSTHDVKTIGHHFGQEVARYADRQALVSQSRCGQARSPGSKLMAKMAIFRSRLWELFGYLEVTVANGVGWQLLKIVAPT